MRLLTFDDHGTPRLAALAGAYIIELARTDRFRRTLRRLADDRADAAARTPDFPATLLQLLRAGDDALAPLAATIDFAAAGSNLERLIEQDLARPVEAIKFLPPIPRPGKIICIGQNYRAHVREMGREMPKYPMFFAKFANTLTGHDGAIVLPRVSTQVDYEAELMIVIGRQGKDIPPAQAFDHIAGYTIFNDVSVRDYQRRTSQFLQGKTFDTTGPCGPYLVTTDEAGDPANMPISLRLNGETMQNSNTADFIFDIPTIIAYLSEIMTLDPGDLIATGTPGGVGSARDPQIFLKAGDVVEVEIGGLGVLRNHVIAHVGS